MFQDSIKIQGDLNITLIDSITNEVKDYRELHNMTVTTGKNFIAQRMRSNTPAVMTCIAVGASSANLVAANTKLVTEIGRAVLTSSTISANTVTYSTTFMPGIGTGSITEAGIFNSNTANAGTMLCRTVFPAVIKAANDTLVINWNVTTG